MVHKVAHRSINSECLVVSRQTPRRNVDGFLRLTIARLTADSAVKINTSCGTDGSNLVAAVAAAAAAAEEAAVVCTPRRVVGMSSFGKPKSYSSQHCNSTRHLILQVPGTIRVSTLDNCSANEISPGSVSPVDMICMHCLSSLLCFKPAFSSSACYARRTRRVRGVCVL